MLHSLQPPARLCPAAAADAWPARLLAALIRLNPQALALKTSAPETPVSCAAADAWHARLLRYYAYFGFRAVRRVGDRGLLDLPDLLVWGGVGTRMDADIGEMLGRWTPSLRASLDLVRGPA